MHGARMVISATAETSRRKHPILNRRHIFLVEGQDAHRAAILLGGFLTILFLLSSRGTFIPASRWAPASNCQLLAKRGAFRARLAFLAFSITKLSIACICACSPCSLSFAGELALCIRAGWLEPVFARAMVKRTGGLSECRGGARQCDVVMDKLFAALQEQRMGMRIM